MFRSAVGHEDRVADRAAKPGHESGVLLGQLARELSALVRRDVEVAAAERLPTLRAGLLDVAAVLAVAVAALFALAALSVAGGRAVATVVPSWLAALVVAGAWLLIAVVAAAVLLRPRTKQREQEVVGLLQILTSDEKLEELRSSREEARDEAEAEMRRSSNALFRTVEHHVKALPSVAKREFGRAEADAAEVIAPPRASARAASPWLDGRRTEAPRAGSPCAAPVMRRAAATSPVRYTRGGSRSSRRRAGRAHAGARR
jgi:membrane protein implicated in regulation of membrane protease activity